LLRIDIVPLVNPNRASLINDTVTVFGVPGSGGGSVNASAASGLAGQGAIVRGNCGSSGCSVTVQGLGEQAYGVRLRGIYEDARVTVTAVDSSNNPVEISGAQVMIDSTGKANDVLRRVQVRLPLASSAGSIPDFAIQTTDTLCKRLQVATTIINVDTSGTGTIDTSACQVAP